jgi:hypothetical protein
MLIRTFTGNVGAALVMAAADLNNRAADLWE